MKAFLILFITTLFLSCNDRQKFNYPLIVEKFDAQSKYDIAVKEMYSLNTCCDCNCKARGISKNGVDTLNIIELDLKLEKLVKKADTLTFVFSFYSIIENDTILFTPFSKSWSSCLYNGISFKGESAIPFPLSYGDASIVELLPNVSSEAAANFEKCLKTFEINSTLKRALEKK